MNNTPKLRKRKAPIRACIAIVTEAFCKHNKALQVNRSPEEQTLLGNYLTVIESEIKQELKKLL